MFKTKPGINGNKMNTESAVLNIVLFKIISLYLILFLTSVTTDVSTLKSLKTDSRTGH